MKKRFVICARATNGCVLYYWEPLNGETMSPSAASWARRFDNSANARRKVGFLREKWKGLTDWTVETVLE